MPPALHQDLTGDAHAVNLASPMLVGKSQDSRRGGRYRACGSASRGRVDPVTAGNVGRGSLSESLSSTARWSAGLVATSTANSSTVAGWSGTGS